MIYQAWWMVTRYYFTLSYSLHYRYNVKFYITVVKALSLQLLGIRLVHLGSKCSIQAQQSCSQD